MMGSLLFVGSVPAAVVVGAPVYRSLTQAVIKATSVNFDFDVATFGPDAALLIEGRMIMTTKKGTPNLTGASVRFADICIDIKNGVLNVQTSGAGGSSNPMNDQPQMLTIHPETADADLQSGGGAAPGTTAGIVGGGSTILRYIVTNPNAANDAEATVILTIWKKAA